MSAATTCPNCQSLLRPGASACHACGAQWTLTCPTCGGDVLGSDAHCPNCQTILFELAPCPHCNLKMRSDSMICPACGGERCPNCGAALSQDELQCPQCGEQFVAVCPICGEELPPEATRCSQCGEPLTDAGDVAPGEEHCPHCGAAVSRIDGVCTVCGGTYCPRCATPTTEDDERCPSCQLALHFDCPDCHQELLAAAAQCPNCNRLFVRECSICHTEIFLAPIACPHCHNALPAEKASSARPALDRLDLLHEVACPVCGRRFDPSSGPCPSCKTLVCRNCAALVIEDEEYCGRCGASLQLDAEEEYECPRCHNVVNPSDEVCPACALDLSGRCPTCHADLPDDVDACPACGQFVCPDCGSAIQEDALACSTCGALFTLHCPQCDGMVTMADSVCPHCHTQFSW